MGVEEGVGRYMTALRVDNCNCVQESSLGPLWQVHVDDDELFGSSIVRLSDLVRGCYLKYLQKVLATNCELCSGSDFAFTSHDVERCAAQMELCALRACMVSSLYQKAMAQMILAEEHELIMRTFAMNTADVKQDTKELKLYRKLKELLEHKCTCCRKETKETQTDVVEVSAGPTESSKKQSCPNQPDVPSMLQALPIPVHVSTSNNFNYLDDLNAFEYTTFTSDAESSSVWFGSDRASWPGNRKPNGRYNSLKASDVLHSSAEQNGMCVNRLYKQSGRLLTDKATAEIRVEEERTVDSECAVRNVNVVKRVKIEANDDAKIEQNVDLVCAENKVIASEPENTASVNGTKRTRPHDKKKANDAVKRLKIPIKEEKLPESENVTVPEDNGTKDLLRMLESEGEDDLPSSLSADAKANSSLLISIENNSEAVESSEPSIWSIQKYIQQRMLHDNISKMCCDHEKKMKMKNRFLDLFGYDTDEEEVWCSQEQITKYKRRISPWVVKQLLPYYKQKRLKSRTIFKAVAREIAHKLICINHFPDEGDVEKGVKLFFSYHGVVTSESDIWDRWSNTLQKNGATDFLVP